MTQERIFPKGIRFFSKHEKQPDFVKGAIVISLNELIQFCKDNPSLLSEYQGVKQLKLQLTESKEGKLVLSVDQYKKEDASIGADKSQGLPF